ncbi:hypothetical protein RRG08_039787 [Elysia crispata]|uniref:Uncharacterized protein n=1 Tax=Elysia crispata TaxID=231223 RepID=A0AAE1AU43_9GAST|nr:hypothetical protein RRG08_039787 [Elysia crispata]
MDNSYVLRWLESSSNYLNSPETFHGSSSWHRVPFFSHDRFFSTRPRVLQKAEKETNIQLLTAQPPPVVSCCEKKDVGIQVQMDIIQAKSKHCLCQPRRHISCWLSQPELKDSPTNPALFSQPMISQHHTCPKESSFKTVQSSLRQPFDDHNTRKSFSFGQNSLYDRAVAVWRIIQAEKSVADHSPSDFSIIETNTSPSSSKSLNEQSSDEGDEENQFANDEKQNSETIVDLEPSRQSYPPNCLHKMFDHDFESNSFVVSQSGRIKCHAGIQEQRSSILTSPVLAQQTSQSVMFPMSYINQFSPNNPDRRDSDKAIYQYQQQLLTSALTYKSMLRSFRPRRNQHKARRVSISHTKVKPTCAVLPKLSNCFERPLKFRKVTNLSLSKRKIK